MMMNKTLVETDQNLTSLLFYYLNSCLIEALEHILFIALAYLLVCLSVYHLVHNRFAHLLINKIRLPPAERVLLVIAHPDDECMFFGPTILSLARRKNCQVYLLCLSNGDFEGEGSRRREELWNACAVLNIPEENVTLVNATHLQDGPHFEWKVETICRFISKEVETLDIDLLITFDRHGVSHHPNHCAIYYAVASLCLSKLIPENCKILTLDSINLLRKYSAVFDLPVSIILSRYWSFLPWRDRDIVKDAMRQHMSQMKWFRKLYLIFSRYIIINTLHEMNVDDIELEMQIND